MQRSSPLRRRLLAGGLVAALSLTAACGGRDDDDDVADAPETEETTAPTEAPADDDMTEESTAEEPADDSEDETMADDTTADDTTATTEAPADDAADEPFEYVDQGISDTEIVLGSSYPFSGPVSAFGSQGKGAEAYFAYVNDTQGGITFADGKTRKVVFPTYDDAYEPQRAVENARRMVEQDGIFAFMNPFGSPTSAAVAPYAHEEGVPMIFVSSSSDQWGDGERWPLAVPFSIVGSTEGSVFANWLLEENPDAQVAVLFQNDDFGKGTAEAFRRALEGTSVTVVAEESYQTSDPTVDSQITNLEASGADTFMMIATPKFAAQALTKINELGWEPLRITQTSGSSITSVLEPVGLDIAEGLVSLSWYKDVTDPVWADDPAVKEYKEQAANYGADPDDPFGGTGWLMGQMAHNLFETMDTPTREGLMEAVLDWDADGVGLMLPGMRLHTEPPSDRYPMEASYMMTFDGERWVLADDPVDAEGQTVPTPPSS